MQESRTEMELRLMGYQTTTAEILYHMPDHPHVLQSFIWQTLDMAPLYPRIHKFLDFWVHNIDGVLHSVHLAVADNSAPKQLNFIDGQFRVH